MDRFLIVKLGAVGDVVHSLPVLETLRTRFPSARIGWVVEGAAEPLLRGHPLLDEVILLDRGRLKAPGGLRYFRSWARSLKGKKYGVAIDLHNLLKTGVISFSSGAPVRIGFRRFREGNFIFTNRRVGEYKKYPHAVQKYLSLLGPLGINPGDWKIRFGLHWDPEDEKTSGAFWDENNWGPDEKVVAINPGANWPSKQWPLGRFSQLADRLSGKYGVRILLLWGPGERNLAQGIAGGMDEASFIAPETTLRSLLPLLLKCRLMISGDTGPVHLAAALGVPTVCLFGPSHPRRNAPFGEGHVVVQSPVPPATHWQRKEVGNHWMAGIPVEKVFEAAAGKLE
ncbi:MAG TPA: glycosyltransferase family 9 protein [Nitrospiria bacterium]